MVSMTLHSLGSTVLLLYYFPTHHGCVKIPKIIMTDDQQAKQHIERWNDQLTNLTNCSLNHVAGEEKCIEAYAMTDAHAASINFTDGHLYFFGVEDADTYRNENFDNSTIIMCNTSKVNGSSYGAGAILANLYRDSGDMDSRVTHLHFLCEKHTERCGRVACVNSSRRVAGHILVLLSVIVTFILIGLVHCLPHGSQVKYPARRKNTYFLSN